MMRGPYQSAMAIRRPDGSITTETWVTFAGGRKWYQKVPILRGCFSFIDSLRVGYRCLMRSADLAGFDEEPTAFEKKLTERFGKKATDAITYLAMLLGVILAVGLFMLLPSVLVDLAGETGRDAGFVAVSYDREASCGRVEMLYLDPEYRGRGLGRQLLKMGLSCLEIHCIREKRIAVPYGGGAALRLCESFGFRPQRVECLLRP